MQSAGSKPVGTGSDEVSSVIRGVARLNLADDNSSPVVKQDKGKPKLTPEEIAVLKYVVIKTSCQNICISKTFSITVS